MDRDMKLSRRDWLRLSAAGVLGASASGWFPLIAKETAKEKVKHKSCILLFANGGPSQHHTFDHKGRGAFKSIATSVPGIHIGEHLPKVAEQMQHLAILRCMATGESDHRKGKYLMHKAFKEFQGGNDWPSMGSIAAKELGSDDFELPNYVNIYTGKNNVEAMNDPLGNAISPGYIGPKYSPLLITDPAKGVENLKPLAMGTDLDARLKMLGDMNSALEKQFQSEVTLAHRLGVEKAVQLMQSARGKVFDISQEPQNVRDAYCTSKFGEGCLMARRLIEAGVSFVEVVQGGWDTHDSSEVAMKIQGLCQALDSPMATLITDLKDRGLLDSTLIIWMGEFGRSPGAGTNHYGKAWCSVVGGAGLKTGQTIGKTDSSAGTVVDHPLSAGDMMATVLKALGIDSAKRFRNAGGRPFNMLPKDSKPVEELFA